MHQNELSSYKWRLNKMKNKIILIATTLVILLAVTMPAMGEVVYLTNSNKFPDGEFGTIP
jgi:hypothetical protein